MKTQKLILASKSPRRKQLLHDMGFDFEIRTKSVDEDYSTNLKREEIAIYLCEKKAKAFSENEIGENEIIITADTIVCLGNEILNKPGNSQHAIEMLNMLSGKEHQVITGVCLRNKVKIHSFYVVSDVYFRHLTQKEIEFYVENYKPFDKAGAYGIQEWIGYIGIEKIKGSYYNVVGLPTARLYEELKVF